MCTTTSICSLKFFLPTHSLVLQNLEILGSGFLHFLFLGICCTHSIAIHFLELTNCQKSQFLHQFSTTNRTHESLSEIIQKKRKQCKRNHPSMIIIYCYCSFVKFNYCYSS